MYCRLGLNNPRLLVTLFALVALGFILDGSQGRPACISLASVLARVIR